MSDKITYLFNSANEEGTEEFKLSILIHLALLLFLSAVFVWRAVDIKPLPIVVPVRLVSSVNVSKTGSSVTGIDKNNKSALKKTAAKKTLKPKNETKTKTAKKISKENKTIKNAKIPKTKAATNETVQAPLKTDLEITGKQNDSMKTVAEQTSNTVIQEPLSVADSTRPSIHSPSFDSVSRFTLTPGALTPVNPPLPVQQIGERIDTPMPTDDFSTDKPGSTENEVDSAVKTDNVNADTSGDEFEVNGIQSFGSWSERFEPPRILSKVLPVYPEWARRKGIRGQAVYKVLIQKSGTVGDVMTMSSTIDPKLAIIGAQALRRWIFTPVLSGGEPQETWVQIAVQFKLN